MVQPGQNVNVPPALIVIGEMPEAIPAVIRRGLGLISAEVGVAPLFIKVAAVTAGVIEHTVQNHADSAGLTGLQQSRQGLFSPQHRVHRFIVPGIIAMIGGRVKHRIEVQGSHAERRKVIQLFRNAVQRSPKEHVVFQAIPRMLGKGRRSAGKIRLRHRTRPERHGTAPPEKAIRENLIHRLSVKPRRRLAFRLVNQQPEPLCRTAAQGKVHLIYAVGKKRVRASQKQDFPIIKPLGQAKGNGVKVPIPLGLFIRHRKILGRLVRGKRVGTQPQHRAAVPQPTGNGKRNHDLGAGGKGAFFRAILSGFACLFSDGNRPDLRPKTVCIPQKHSFFPLFSPSRLPLPGRAVCVS